jgi:putative membrane protein
MRRSWSATLSVTGLFIVAIGLGIANAQSAARPTDEHTFVSQVAMSNMAAIQLGHMATKKAQNADVQKFAQATIQDHLKAQQQLADAAYGAGIRWPTKLDDKHQQIQQRLSKLSNEQFDREFMKTMVERHRDVEKMLAARVNSGGSSESPLAAKVQQWAASTLPDVRAELKEAEQVYGGLGTE